MRQLFINNGIWFVWVFLTCQMTIISVVSVRMLNAIYVINNEPVPIVAKQIRGSPTSQISQYICSIFSSTPDKSAITPFQQVQGLTVIIRQSGEVWLVATVEGDGDALFFSSMLAQAEELLHQYIENPLTDFGVKDNFSQIYRILDLFIDCGFPLADDVNSMMQFIPKSSSETRATVNLVHPWRCNGITYKRAQILIDVVEYVDFCVNLNGRPDLQQIRGKISLKSEVNDNPRIRFCWKNSPVFEDISFHRCVDYDFFKKNNSVDFVPPHGHSYLAEYRIQQHQLKLPLDIKSVIVPSKGKFDIRITVNCVEKDVEDIILKFAIIGIRSPSITTKFGKIDVNIDEVIWTIGKMKVGKSAELTGSVNCDDSCRQTCVRVQFKVPETLVSGCELGSFQIEGGDASSFVGAKYETRNGKYQFRAGQV